MRCDNVISDTGQHMRGAHEAPILWCLGGPEVLVRPDDEHDYDDRSCVDLTIYVCERHKVIEVDLWPHSISDHTPVSYTHLTLPTTSRV